MELEPRIEQPQGRARTAAAVGAVSVLLLYAAFRWAHHWGLLADTIVAAWTFATLSGFALSIWSLRTSKAARRLANLGFALASISVVALTVAGIAFAAGMDPAGACGGG